MLLWASEMSLDPLSPLPPVWTRRENGALITSPLGIRGANICRLKAQLGKRELLFLPRKGKNKRPKHCRAIWQQRLF